ncbi:cytochrome c [Ferrimonas sp. YFM]|uniref:c-type cytochrome n=1 Tax=Ferrimonas sp. YFM TaxID=3028878 RepID=UPI002572C983|nr:cytochrome c [Ferrimonas sp. YFM]BDY06167.1 periplasmic monoheme cytochrome c [Ferrimonas sp. YFM]
MKRRSYQALTAVLLLTVSAGLAAAEGGNPKKGKHLYKKHCKACHSQNSEAMELTPMSKTMAQWDRFFQRNKHKAKPEVFQGLSDQALKDIQQFLYDHAADSDQPATCG